MTQRQKDRAKGDKGRENSTETEEKAVKSKRNKNTPKRIYLPLTSTGK